MLGGMAVETPRRRHVHFSLEGESGKFLAYGPPDLFEEFLRVMQPRACAHCPDATEGGGRVPSIPAPASPADTD